MRKDLGYILTMKLLIAVLATGTMIPISSGPRFGRLRKPADDGARDRDRPRWGLPEAYARSVCQAETAVMNLPIIPFFRHDGSIVEMLLWG